MANEYSVAESGKTAMPINEKYMLTIKEEGGIREFQHRSEKDAAFGGGQPRPVCGL